MNFSRRRWFRYTGLSALGAGALGALSGVEARAETSRVAEPAQSADRSPTPIHTLNGWTLPHRLVDGVKVFHLVAEEIDHEFAPGTRARCWGYNGSTPGPTIEAVEGDRVRIYVTNRLPEHTSIHWHGILLPSGMDGVGGLSQPHKKEARAHLTASEFALLLASACLKTFNKA